MPQALSTGSLARVALAASLAASLTVAAVSQTQPEKSDAARQSYVIRETTHRVLVDVVVTDEKGKPVPGLKKSDFSVWEDKKPQTILSFDVEDGDKPSFVPQICLRCRRIPFSTCRKSRSRGRCMCWSTTW